MSNEPTSNDVVVVTVAIDEMGAEMACGVLRVEGIQATHRISDMAVAGTYALGSSKRGLIGPLMMMSGGQALPGSFARGNTGYRDVLVMASDYQRAHEILSAQIVEDDVPDGQHPDSVDTNG